MKSFIAKLCILISLGFGLGYFVIASEKSVVGDTELSTRFPFRLGLDLSGGSQLIYRGDISSLPEEDVEESLAALRDVIERRVNLFGVSETTVQVEKSFNGEHRLIVELPGVTNVEEAVAMIGQTPTLEFKVETPSGIPSDLSPEQNIDQYFVPTELTGRFLENASLQFTQPQQGGSFGGEPYIVLRFNEEGAILFEKITEASIGKVLAIYLDGYPISMPIVQQSISGGEATITGAFSPEEAKQLVGRLNSGALPIPIELISTQTISAPLGNQAVKDGIQASILGLTLLGILFVLWYRIPGIVAVIALLYYACTMLVLFKVVPVTLTAAGIAGFIISLGVAVDANVLIAERIKDEIKKGATVHDAIEKGFGRAWTAIRDANLAGIITSVVLFWFGTSLIQGFALTLGMGIIASLLSATFVSKVTMQLFARGRESRFRRFLFSSGFSK